MDYAAPRQYVNPQGGPLSGVAHGGLPWELDGGAAGARQETWLLSFIDILALLLTLFVLLLAYQDQRPERNDVATTVASVPTLPFSLPAFIDSQVLLPVATTGTPGFAMPGAGLVPLENVSGAPQSNAAAEPSEVEEETHADEAEPVVEDTHADKAEPMDAAEEVPVAAEWTDNAALPASFQEASMSTALPDSPAATPASFERQAVETVLDTFAASQLKDRVEVIVEPGAVSLEISDSILFAPASASLSVEGLALLGDLAGVLQGLPHSLSVEGHSDNMPIQTARFPSNWELSSARAAAVTRKLIEKGVSPQRIRAIGYGQTRPRAANTSAEGRARNRRVSFVLALEADR